MIINLVNWLGLERIKINDEKIRIKVICIHLTLIMCVCVCQFINKKKVYWDVWQYQWKKCIFIQNNYILLIWTLYKAIEMRRECDEFIIYIGNTTITLFELTSICKYFSFINNVVY